MNYTLQNTLFGKRQQLSRVKIGCTSGAVHALINHENHGPLYARWSYNVRLEYKRRILKGRLNLVSCEFRVFALDLVDGLTCGDLLQDELDGDPGTAYDRLTEHSIRIGVDVFLYSRVHKQPLDTLFRIP